MTTPDPEQLIRMAAGLAARGDYEAAQAVLDKVPPGPDTPSADRLRAKIAAQQGQVDRAAGLWRQVLQSNPDDAEAQQALRLLEKMASRRAPDLFLRARLYYTLLLSVILVLLVAVIGLGWNAWTGTAHPEPTQAAAEPEESLTPLTKAIEAIQASQGEDARLLAGRITELQNELSALAARPPAEPPQLTERLDTLTASHQQRDQALLKTADALAQRLESLDQDLRQTADGLAQRMESLDQAVAQLEERVRADHAEWPALLEALRPADTAMEQRLQEELDHINQGMSLLLAGTLSQQMRELTTAYQALERKFWWRSEREKQAALARLDRLRDTVDTLVRRLEQP